MAKKDNPKISISALERVAKEQSQEVITESWFDNEVIIKRSISLVEMMEFCRDITDACFTQSGEFVPEILDFAVKSGVLTRYANFTLPDNLEKQYWLINNTNAYDMVIQYINMTQLSEIVNAANRKLKMLCDSDILAFRSRMDELIVLFGNMQKQTENVFSGISGEDIMTIMSAVDKTGTLSESRVVDAYMNRMRQEAADAGDNVIPFPAAEVTEDDAE
jgi:hypothetical protein